MTKTTISDYDQFLLDEYARFARLTEGIRIRDYESLVPSNQLVRVKITNVEYDFNNPLYPASTIPSDYNPYIEIGKNIHVHQGYLRENCVIDFLEEWINPLFPITKLEFDMFPSL
jgi:hypothetical protein